MEGRKEGNERPGCDEEDVFYCSTHKACVCMCDMRRRRRRRDEDGKSKIYVTYNIRKENGEKT